MNQEIYSLHDCRRGVLQKHSLPWNSLEEEGRRNVSNSLKSHQGLKMPFPKTPERQDVGKDIQGSTDTPPLGAVGPGLQKTLSSAERGSGGMAGEW